MTQISMLPDEDRPSFPPSPVTSTAVMEPPYRFELRRIWAPGPLIMWCGCNPSDANASRNDPTILREIGFSFRWGFGGMIKVNRHPFIASKMENLRRWLAAGDVHFGGEISAAYYRNDQQISWAARECTMHIAAWGNLVEPVDVTEWLGVMAAEYPPINWHCIGRTMSGAPTHPMARGKHRVPDAMQPTPWRQAT